MLQEDDPLISEPVIEEIDHIPGGGLKAQAPEIQLVLDHSLHAGSPPSDRAR